MRSWRRRRKIRREKEARDCVSRGCVSLKFPKLGGWTLAFLSEEYRRERVSAVKDESNSYQQRYQTGGSRRDFPSRWVLCSEGTQASGWAHTLQLGTGPMSPGASPSVTCLPLKTGVCLPGILGLSSRDAPGWGCSPFLCLGRKQGLQAAGQAAQTPRSQGVGLTSSGAPT